MIEFDEIGQEIFVPIDGTEGSGFSGNRLSVYGKGEFFAWERIWYFEYGGFFRSFLWREINPETEYLSGRNGDGLEKKISGVV